MDFDVALEDLYIGRFIEVDKILLSGKVNTFLSPCAAGSVQASP